jgi:hypothetical protein
MSARRAQLGVRSKALSGRDRSGRPLEWRRRRPRYEHIVARHSRRARRALNNGGREQRARSYFSSDPIVLIVIGIGRHGDLLARRPHARRQASSSLAAAARSKRKGNEKQMLAKANQRRRRRIWQAHTGRALFCLPNGKSRLATLALFCRRRRRSSAPRQQQLVGIVVVVVVVACAGLTHTQSAHFNYRPSQLRFFRAIGGKRRTGPAACVACAAWLAAAVVVVVSHL